MKKTPICERYKVEPMADGFYVMDTETKKPLHAVYKTEEEAKAEADKLNIAEDERHVANIGNLMCMAAEMRAQFPDDCDDCKGTGKTPAVPELSIAEETCHRCKGVGKVEPFFPAVVLSVEFPNFSKPPIFGKSAECGDFVAVRMVSEKRTELGIFIGDMPHAMSGFYDKKKGELKVVLRHNPCIFIPDRNKLVWGIESWWGKLEKPEDLKQITDADIQNVWYMRALKALTKDKPNEEKTTEPGPSDGEPRVQAGS